MKKTILILTVAILSLPCFAAAADQERLALSETRKSEQQYLRQVREGNGAGKYVPAKEEVRAAEDRAFQLSPQDERYMWEPVGN